MAVNIYYDKDCDLSIIQGMKVAVIGYGPTTRLVNDLAKELHRPLRNDTHLVAKIIKFGREGEYIPTQCIEEVALLLRDLSR